MIDEAKKFIDANDQSFEDLIADLETSRSTIEKERLEIEQYKSEVSQLKEKLETKQDNLARQKERVLREANEQARKILQDAKDYADQTIRDMNKLAAGKMANMKELEHKRSAVRDKLSKTDERLTLKKDKAKEKPAGRFPSGETVSGFSASTLKAIFAENRTAKDALPFRWVS